MTTRPLFTFQRRLFQGTLPSSNIVTHTPTGVLAKKPTREPSSVDSKTSGKVTT